MPLAKMAARGGRSPSEGLPCLRPRSGSRRRGGTRSRPRTGKPFAGHWFSPGPAVPAPPLPRPPQGAQPVGEWWRRDRPGRGSRVMGEARSPAGLLVKVKALEPVKNLGVETGQHYAELFPEPPEWLLDRAVLSAFDSWRCPLLGLLLGMCAPGGCGSRALAGGLGVLGRTGQLPAEGSSPLRELA